MEFLIGKTILVTGGSGYLGSTLVEKLSKIDANIVILSRSSDSWCPVGPHRAVRRLVGDIATPDVWLEALQEVDVVYHLAALEYKRHDFDHHGDLSSNFLGMVNLLRACEKRNVKPRIVFASSANIVGLDAPLPVSESCDDDPPSIWSLHKLIAEKYLRFYALHRDVPAVSLRIGNIYGVPANWNTFGNVVINRAIGDALSGEKLKIFSNSHVLRDFVNIDDVVEALLLAAPPGNLMAGGEHYYIGSGSGISFEEGWKLIAGIVENVTGRPVTIECHDVPLEPLDMRSFVSDCSAFQGITGWTSRISFPFGVASTIRQALAMSHSNSGDV